MVEAFEQVRRLLYDGACDLKEGEDGEWRCAWTLLPAEEEVLEEWVGGGRMQLVEELLRLTVELLRRQSHNQSKL